MVLVSFAISGCASKTVSPSPADEPGRITFGTALDQSTDPPVARMGRIEPASTLAYVARFNAPLPTAQPVITIARVVGASEELVRSTTLSLAAPGYTAIWSEMPTLLDPGRYRMRVE